MPKPLTVWITTNCGADLMGLSSLSRAPGTWPLIFPSVESDPSQDPEQPGPASTLRWLGTLPQGGG